MNELDLLLAETVEACRHRRHVARIALQTGRRGRINLARPLPRTCPAKALTPAA